MYNFMWGDTFSSELLDTVNVERVSDDILDKTSLHMHSKYIE
jgi:hypothetical protein